DTTGAGWHIDVPMVHAVLMNLSDLYEIAGREGTAPRIANRHMVHAPQGVYPCAGDDRWVVLTVRNDDEWRALVRLTGADAAWSAWTRDERHANHDAIDAHIRGWAAGRDRH